ncbi:amino acid transporter [Cryptococcus neoformans Gb118]|nr:amino acid transporter [Cryptococcus neoformans var. grubii MW-RSA36]OXL10481.1 amino acid transporter [Cryptococcus neoformans var. grubii Gb118]
MENLKIKVLPSIVNACLIVIILSAGNAFTFNTTRSLHALALDGKAPGILIRLSRHGVPYTCCVVVMLLTCPSYLALGSSSKVVLNWILNHHVQLVMAITWIPFNVAMKAQKNRLQVIPPRAFQEPALCWPGRSFGPGCSSGFRATPFLKRQLGCGNLHLQLRYYRSCGRNRSWFQDLCAYSVPPLKRCRPQDRPRLL